MSFLVKQNTATAYTFFMADPTDMTQGKTGLNTAGFTLRLHSPNESSFTQSTPTVTEIGYGVYKIVVTLSGLGRRFAYISADGAVPWRDTLHVVESLPGELTDTMIDKIVASIFRTTMDAIEDSSEGTAITTTNLSLYKAVMSLVGKVALISTTKRIYQTDETTTALDLTMTSGQGPASPFISQEP